MALADNRPAVLAREAIPANFTAIEIAAAILNDQQTENPDIDLASVHFTDEGEFVTMTARCGPLSPEATDAAHDAAVAAALAGTRLAGPCSSCHQLPGRPPTEYCTTPELHHVQP
jgi:hypothetical protein